MQLLENTLLFAVVSRRGAFSGKSLFGVSWRCRQSYLGFPRLRPGTQLQLRFIDQMPWRYEVIRPLVLFADRTATRRAQETHTHPDTVWTLERRFRQQGMVGLLPKDVKVEGRGRASRGLRVIAGKFTVSHNRFIIKWLRWLIHRCGAAGLLPSTLTSLSAYEVTDSTTSCFFWDCMRARRPTVMSALSSLP